MANAILNVGQTGGQVNISTAAAPATPAAGVVTLYAGTDKALHALNSDGTDITIAAAGAASPITVQQTNSLVSTTTGATATACASVVVGLNTSSTATQTVAIGSSTCTTGLQSVAIGNTTCATNFSVAIGHNARATNELVVALGYQAISSADRAVAIGYAAANTAACGIAIGVAANNSGLIGIALGGNAVNTEAYAIVIGKSACTASGIGASSVVIGEGAKHCTYGEESIIIGKNAYSTNIGIVSIGTSASGNSQNGVNIGVSSCTVCNNSQSSVAIGKFATAYGAVVGSDPFADIAIGNAAIARFGDALAIGQCSFACSHKSTAIGGLAKVFPGATGTMVLGNSSVGGTAACNSVVLGNSSQTTASDTVTIGDVAVTTAACAIAMGNAACSTAASAIGIGEGAKAESSCGIAIGFNSCVSSGFQANIAIGEGAYVYAANRAIAIGWQTCSIDTSVSVGSVSCAIGGQSTAIGYGSIATAVNATAIGFYASATACEATAFGAGAISSACSSNAIGNGATASHDYATAIGFGVATEKTNTVHVNNLIAYGQAASKAHAVGSTGGTVAIDWDNSNVQTLTLTSSATVSMSNPIDGGVYTLQITQGGSGSNTITWSNIKWPGGTPPTLSTAVGALDVLTFIYGPTAYVGNANLNFS